MQLFYIFYNVTLFSLFNIYYIDQNVCIDFIRVIFFKITPKFRFKEMKHTKEEFNLCVLNV